MGLKDLFSRWSKAKDADAIRRAQGESQMTEQERETDQEDYEARKDDMIVDASWPGSAAREAADDVESP